MKPWREKTSEARERGSFSLSEKYEAKTWDQCAVGEQHRAMPNVVVYSRSKTACMCERCQEAPSFLTPRDMFLYDYGANFHVAVHDDNFDKADALLDAIEDRVMVLKREHGS